MWTTATTNPVLSFPATIQSDTRPLKRNLEDIQTCAMDQTRVVWVVPDVGQNFKDGVRSPLNDLHVE